MTKEEVLAMKVGQNVEIVFSNGVAKVTKDVTRESDTEWQLNCYTAEASATVTADEIAAYCKDRNTGNNFNWKEWVQEDENQRDTITIWSVWKDAAFSQGKDYPTFYKNKSEAQNHFNNCKEDDTEYVSIGECIVRGWGTDKMEILSEKTIEFYHAG